MFCSFTLLISKGNEWEESVEVIDNYTDQDGYYIYIPKQSRSEQVVVMLHGYGALNPMIYGAWIKHLRDQGHIIIYPRYQDKIMGTKTKRFANNAATAIKNARKELEDKGIEFKKSFHFTGHSYGGAIAAYIGVYYEELGLNIPASIQMCQPGTGPLKGLKLKTYKEFDLNIPFAVVVGSEDKTVGEFMGKNIYESSSDHIHKVFVRHLPDKNIEPEITATHYEPYAIDEDLDNNIINYTSRRALAKSKLDEVDYMYWDVFDQLISQPESLFQKEEISFKLSSHN